MRNNPGRRPLNDKEPQPKTALPNPPEHLSDEAKREWKRVGKLLADLGLVSELDRGALAGYCQAWGRWVEAEEALTRSIREFGLVDPIIARQDDKMVIGGHQRLVAARKLGLKSVPVIFLDVSAEQERLLNLALNRISGAWDEELLGRMVADITACEEIDLGLSGFSEDEVASMREIVEKAGEE